MFRCARTPQHIARLPLTGAAVYRDNVAYRSGGAVYAMGSQLSTLLITGVIFDTNIVQTPTDGAGVELTVRLNSKIELSRFAHPCR